MKAISPHDDLPHEVELVETRTGLLYPGWAVWKVDGEICVAMTTDPFFVVGAGDDANDAIQEAMDQLEEVLGFSPKPYVLGDKFVFAATPLASTIISIRRVEHENDEIEYYLNRPDGYFIL